MLGPLPSDRVTCGAPVEVLRGGYLGGLCVDCGRREREMRERRRENAAAAAQASQSANRVVKAGVVPFRRDKP
jgi:hypothetical protein